LPAARAAIQEKYCTGPELLVSEKVVPLDMVANNEDIPGFLKPRDMEYEVRVQTTLFRLIPAASSGLSKRRMIFTPATRTHSTLRRAPRDAPTQNSGPKWIATPSL